MVVGVSPAVAMPSISEGFKPASLRALRAASACSWIWERSGITPRSVVSAAPTTATVPGFMGSPAASGLEEGQGDRVALPLEGDLEGHVQHQSLRCLRAAHNIAHHARPLFQLDHGNGVRRREAWSRAVVNDVTEQPGPAAGSHDRDFARGAFRTERPGRKVRMPAVVAALQPQLASPRALPEVLGLRRGYRQRSRLPGHGSSLLGVETV